MHQHVRSNMARAPDRCVTISACLTGVLLLLPFCWGVKDDHYDQYDYDFTQSPEFDYNSTIAISFFSNTSSDELEKFLFGGVTDSGETSTVEAETDGNVQERPAEPTVSVMSQASRSVPVCFLLTVVLMVHQLLRL